ncbi:hypothetical protein NA56DRAFT_159495 [Hyaloscypha hepaticicola]|uniref:Uncharacterized protein n=1 Tax=Hyaloscypha hepaticicola TaxID=2082293 RepID=A0A2J6Q3T7_9HELO|nr:hypothetical protein NA56DRAFT_159495 [Hyaloscypha hepaticicola]
MASLVIVILCHDSLIRKTSTILPSLSRICLLHCPSIAIMLIITVFLFLLSVFSLLSSVSRILLSRLDLTRFGNLLGAKRITKHSHTSVRTRIFSRKLGLGAQRGLGSVVRC